MKFLSALLLVLVASTGVAAQRPSGDILVYHPDGWTLSIPAESWEVSAVPRGFNTGSYSDVNSKGKLPGWGGWPEYFGDCSKELAVSPRRCDRQPFFLNEPNTPE